MAPRRARFLAAWTCALLATGTFAGLGLVALRTELADHFLAQVDANPNLSPEAKLLSLTRATRLRPDLSEAWQRSAEELAPLDPSAALPLAATAVRLDPDNWQNWRTLGLLQLQLNQLPLARSSWRRAAVLNNGFESHFQAANLAFLLGDIPGFWSELQKAVRIAPPNDVGLALQAAVRLAGAQPQRLMALVPAGRPFVAAKVIDVLIGAGHLNAATHIWDSLECPGYNNSDCRGAALDLANAWLQQAGKPRNAPGLSSPITSAASVQHALQVWNAGVRMKLLPNEPAQAGSLTDAAFLYPWIGGWTWQLLESPAQVQPDDARLDRNILTWTASGDQPDHVMLTWQWVALQPETGYRLEFESRAEPAQTLAGLHVRLLHADGTPMADEMAPLDENWRGDQKDLRVPAGCWLGRLEISYDRPYGEALLQGELALRGLRLLALPSPSVP